MNKLITSHNGGYPFVLDDLRWMDAGYREGFYGLLSAFGVSLNETFVLSGCVRTADAGVVTVTEGYVSIAGEVYHLPTQNYPEPQAGEVEYFEVDQSYDPTGSKVFQNGSNHDAYQIRKAKVVAAVTPPTLHTVVEGAKSLFEVVQEKLVKSDSYNLPESGSLATSKAVSDVKHYLESQIFGKLDKAEAIQVFEYETNGYAGLTPPIIFETKGTLVVLRDSSTGNNYGLSFYDGQRWHDMLNEI